MILICGASGLVGKEMCKFLDEQNTSYIGTYNNNRVDKNNMFKLDFADPGIVEEFLLQHNQLMAQNKQEFL